MPIKSVIHDDDQLQQDEQKGTNFRHVRVAVEEVVGDKERTNHEKAVQEDLGGPVTVVKQGTAFGNDGEDEKHHGQSKADAKDKVVAYAFDNQVLFGKGGVARQGQGVVEIPGVHAGGAVGNGIEQVFGDLSTIDEASGIGDEGGCLELNDGGGHGVLENSGQDDTGKGKDKVDEGGFRTFDALAHWGGVV